MVEVFRTRPRYTRSLRWEERRCEDLIPRTNDIASILVIVSNQNIGCSCARVENTRIRLSRAIRAYYRGKIGVAEEEDVMALVGLEV
jgi:hypothetical protein